MKKMILLIVAVTSIVTFVNAQSSKTDFREDFKFGLKIGANYSNVYDTHGEEFRADGKLGLATGAFISIPLSQYIGIQPEILLSQKGFKATGEIFGSPYEMVRTTTYLDIPLFFSFKPSEFFTLLAGPEYSYLLKQKDTFTNSLISYEQEQEFSNDNIRENTLSLIVGSDVNIKSIVIGLRAGWDLQENEGDGTSNTPRYKNVWYQMTFGYRF
ncbi:MAG: porin family protein [Bacteroidales bacterium]